MKPITLQLGESFRLPISDDPVVSRAMARGYRVELFPGCIESLGRGHFRQPFLVQIDGADYRTLHLEWSEEPVRIPWWKRWRLRIYQGRGEAK